MTPAVLDLLRLLNVLHVAGEKVAHYTTVEAGKKIVSPGGTLKLFSIGRANDFRDGKALFRDRAKTKVLPIQSLFNHLFCFIGCFTFNHAHLTQYRLYGKAHGQEASGLSLVVQPDFFEQDLSASKRISAEILAGEDGKIKETGFKKLESLPLFRVVYADVHGNICI